jgi:Protein of unknown function (DUF1064)
MYRTQKSLPAANSLICPKCSGTRFVLGSGKVTCTNCGWTHKTGNNKYGAKRSIANDGVARDSKYEATVADELLLRKAGKDILDYESQYRIDVPCYRSDGSVAFIVHHKVDFRVWLKDGSYELLEAKGVETDDYKWRRKFLEEIWLPDHPDHTYRVVKQNTRYTR